MTMSRTVEDTSTSRDVRRHAHSAKVEADHAAERRQAPLEAVQRGLGVDRIDRYRRSRQQEQIDRPLAEYLIRDVDVAAFGLANPWSLRHGLRLVPDHFGPCVGSCR
jgi:hypothetical protein